MWPALLARLVECWDMLTVVVGVPLTPQRCRVLRLDYIMVACWNQSVTNICLALRRRLGQRRRVCKLCWNCQVRLGRPLQLFPELRMSYVRGLFHVEGLQSSKTTPHSNLSQS